MSDGRSDPRDRPADPAGTQPKVRPESLLPEQREPIVDADVVDEHLEETATGGEVAAPERPGTALVAGAADHAGALSTHGPQRESGQAPRFQFLLGALIAIGAVALAGAIALVVNGSSSTSGPRWSPWKPTGDKVPEQIARHVGSEYRLPSGHQLALVTGGPLEVAGLPMQVALRSDPSNAGNAKLLSGDGVLYRLCGLGPKCAIDEGKPSVQRHLLLRREALELALYTFRYQSGVDQVVAFMPPKRGCDPDQALFFRRGYVNPELNRPLTTTLTRRTPSVAGIQASPDTTLVNRLTTPTLYSFSLTQQNQDAGVYLVLDSVTQGQGCRKQGAAGGPSSGGPSTTGP